MGFGQEVGILPAEAILDAMYRGLLQPMIEIRVYGMPAPQGSKSFKGMRGGHAILVESSKAVKPWRQDVSAFAREAMAEHKRVYPLTGPLIVEMYFTMPKPKSAPKKRKTFPDRAPDLSKLVRSTEDALTTCGLWEDDARVIQCMAMKVYPREHACALESPGALIRVMERLNL